MAAETMKAIWVEQPGGPEVMEYRDVERPSPGPGEVLVKIEAAGINYSNIGHRKGSYTRAPFPTILGSEGAGRVVGKGDGVTRLADGDRVAFRGSTTGSYAEYAVVPDKMIYKVPDGVSPEVAAALQVQGMTAYVLVNNIAPVGAGQSCLIHAGAGGVGHMVIQIAKNKGVRVLTTVGSKEKGELAKSFGADEVIYYRDEDFAERVLALTDGAGVNAVYDGVGAATMHGSIASAGFQGKVVIFGSPSDGELRPDIRLTTNKAVSVTFGRLSQFVNTPEDVARVSDALVAMVADGSLNLHIADPRPLAEAAEVHRTVEERESMGKQILVP
ncbi:MAG: quinone oxidoreductase [Proteobacteria bacterium]|nr:quinone oxidoreductase [Pseudomonadota bacterium]MDA0869704.1 quinone oxidoreductase [Pseudomonadota bacterium]MDA1328742.1 quinone oxidoreductase [Pseudomonadota bacterium]